MKRIQLICNDATSIYNLSVTAEFGYWKQHSSYELGLDRTSEFLDLNILDKYQKNFSHEDSILCPKAIGMSSYGEVFGCSPSQRRGKARHEG